MDHVVYILQQRTAPNNFESLPTVNQAFKPDNSIHPLVLHIPNQRFSLIENIRSRRSELQSVGRVWCVELCDGT